MAIHLLGIRHHGPGSCRNVLNYLQELQPDLILVEGPAEAEALLACVENPQMTPPVALLAYQPDEPQNAVFYPFAEFSPEWQAMRYAVQNRIPFRFFDLPLIYSLALRAQKTLNRRRKRPLKSQKPATRSTGWLMPQDLLMVNPGGKL